MKHCCLQGVRNVRSTCLIDLISTFRSHMSEGATGEETLEPSVVYCINGSCLSCREGLNGELFIGSCDHWIDIKGFSRSLLPVTEAFCVGRCGWCRFWCSLKQTYTWMDLSCDGFTTDCTGFLYDMLGVVHFCIMERSNVLVLEVVFQFMISIGKQNVFWQYSKEDKYCISYFLLSQKVQWVGPSTK